MTSRFHDTRVLTVAQTSRLEKLPESTRVVGVEMGVGPILRSVDGVEHTLTVQGRLKRVKRAV